MGNRGTNRPILLTEDLLEQLATRWRQKSMPIAHSLRPGLSDAEMDDLTQPLGVILPREARTWWSWHDGAEPGTANLGPGRVFSPLADAVRNTLSVRDVMRGVDGELDPTWRFSWLTMNSGGDTTVIDCGLSFDEPVPARCYRFEEPETGAEGVPSIGTLVSLYIDAFDRRVWTYDADRRVWCGDASNSDPATRNLHLV